MQVSPDGVIMCLWQQGRRRANLSSQFRSVSEHKKDDFWFYTFAEAAIMQVSPDDVITCLRQQGRRRANLSSQYRGVSKHKKGKWEARVGLGKQAAASGLRKYRYG